MKDTFEANKFYNKIRLISRLKNCLAEQHQQTNFFHGKTFIKMKVTLRQSTVTYFEGILYCTLKNVK